MLRRWQEMAVSLVLAVFFAALFLMRVDLAAVFDEIASVRPALLLMAAVMFFLSVGSRGLRWADLVSSEPPVRYRDGVACTYMGWAVNLVSGRLGDLARPLLLARRAGVRRSLVFGTVVLERGLDLVVIGGMLGAYLIFWADPAVADDRARVVLGGLRAAGWMIVAGLLGFAALVVALRARLETPRRWTIAALRLLPERVRGLVSRSGEAFIAGLTGPRERRALARAAANTVLAWALSCSAHWLLLAAFGLDLPLHAVLPLLIMIVIGSLVPTPAAVGSYHAAVQFTLAALLGQPLEAASGYALVSHALGYVPAGLLGVWLLAREGSAALVLRGLRDQEEELAG